jgi:hypothetical protein
MVMLFPKAAPTVCIRSTITDAITGQFSFTNLAPGAYIIAAIDMTSAYGRISYSQIAAVPM